MSQKKSNFAISTDSSDAWRKTEQYLMPSQLKPAEGKEYNIYPTFPASGEISTGYDALAKILMIHPVIVIDGYVGVFFDEFKKEIEKRIIPTGKTLIWHNTSAALKPSTAIDEMIAPFLGGDDPLFGTRCTLELADFFDPSFPGSFDAFSSTQTTTIIIGCGAALAAPNAFTVYIDLPKNELQFRMRGGSALNFGATLPGSNKEMYKRFYFVDWVVLNKHKQNLLPRISLIVDGQRPGEPTLMHGDPFRASLEKMSGNFFRVRPWFEPGSWGGQWMKEHINTLPQNVPNYAWSFELIVPENGLIFSDDNNLLEVSFDFLMFHNNRAVIGAAADRFGFEFPIRFDFLDTFDGGNLSVQCHPSTEYIKKEFGETFTQDETYYILDAKEDAKVYLGFQESIQPDEFRSVLEESAEKATPVEIEQFVQTHPASKFDLFLIPGGTIHGSGKNTMVLEISNTPYIFTFKMYDWLRMDLDGKPRTLNIKRAFENLDFSRKGDLVKQSFISKPVLLDEGEDWKLIHQPTHPNHFYDVYRYDFETSVFVNTEDSCQIMMLVEGEQVLLETKNGMKQVFNYAETFVVPAAAKRFKLTNLGATTAKVVTSFVKANATKTEFKSAK
jgi:mannose-6-phosphate isomerase class I